MRQLHVSDVGLVGMVMVGAPEAPVEEVTYARSHVRCPTSRVGRIGGKPFIFECAACGKQTSVTAGTIMHGLKELVM
ncbi:MAG: hypothetical protein ACLP3R_03960 [Candidatus Korobacteraceae bacterium]